MSQGTLRLLAALAVLQLCVAGQALAQQPLDDVLKGFGDDKQGAPAKKSRDGEKRLLPSWLALGGGVGQDLSYNFAHDAPAAGATDHRGLSGFRSRIDGEADLTFSRDWRARITGYAFYDWAYHITGRDDFTGMFLDAYESDADVGDAYVEGKLAADLDVKIGRQVVVWGKSDNIRITDILNPLDLRLPGRTDIRDLRLPVTMSRLDYFAGDWNLRAIVVHEIRFGKTPVFGSDFFAAPAPPPPEDGPGEGFADQEYAVALNGVFSGWDLSLYGAYVFDDQPHVALTPAGPRLRHSRLTMGGAAADAALGNWLIKGELAFLDGFEFFAAPGETFARLDAMLGVEYSGFADTTVALEIANRHLFGADDRIRQPPDDGRRNDPEAALRLTRKFMHETLDVTALVSVFGLAGENGGFERLQLDYDLTDSVELEAGIVFYQSGEAAKFSGTGDNDRVFLAIRYRL